MDHNCLICYNVCDPLEADLDLKSKILNTFCDLHNFSPNLIQEIQDSSGVKFCPHCIDDLQRAQGIIESIKLYQEELTNIKEEVDRKLKMNSSGILRMKIIGHIEVNGLKRKLASLYPDPSPVETPKGPEKPIRKKLNKRRDLSLGGIFGETVEDVKPLVIETVALAEEPGEDWSPPQENCDISDEETQAPEDRNLLSPEEKERLRSECLSNQPILSLKRLLEGSYEQKSIPGHANLINKRKKLNPSTRRRKELAKMHNSNRKEIKIKKKDGERSMCSECGKTFAQKHNLNEHIKFVHGSSNKNQCQICSKLFSSWKNLKEHMTIHDESSQFLCPHCGKCFKRQLILNIHIKKQHPAPEAAGSFKCTLCTRSYNSAIQLRRHVREGHESEKSSCNQCGKVFKSSYYLKEHMKHIHGKESHPWACDICPQKYLYKNQLERHKIVHHNTQPKPYACDQCEANYLTKWDLNNHVNQIHAKNYNHFCETCGKGFYNLTFLSNHQRQHSGQAEDAKCTFCYKKFKTEEEKIEHEASHSVDINFQCKGCDEAFKGPKHLNDHYKAMHTLPVEQGLTCQCGKVFKRQKILNKHLREVCGREKVKGRPKKS